MAREQTRSLLDVAVSQSRITLLHGLPRVGRSEMIRRWSNGREDAAIRPFRDAGEAIAPIMVFDHLTAGEADEFVRRFRTIEESQANTRFIVAPTDLFAANLLQTALTGIVRTIDLGPLQLDDAISEIPVLSVASGPVPGLVAEASPSNLAIFDPEKHWLRGGLPESLAAESDHASMIWRSQLLANLLARE